MQSLFPTQRSSASNSLVTIKAGKCALRTIGPNRYLVNPENVRGHITLVKTPDGLVKFCWGDRNAQQPEIERIIFPSEAEFKKVQTGRENDRVYMLHIPQGGNQIFMFWLQDKSTEKDNELIAKLNDCMNNPAAADAAAAALNAQNNGGGLLGRGGMGGGMSGFAPDALRQLMELSGGGAASRAQPRPRAEQPPVAQTQATPVRPIADLSSLFGGSLTSNTATAATTSATTSNVPPPVTPAGALSAEDLRRAMSSFTSTPLTTNRIQPPSERLHLDDIITSDQVLNSGILDDPAVRAQLIEHLPEGQRTEEFLEGKNVYFAHIHSHAHILLLENIRSPQFRQALGQLGAALNSDNYNNIMASLQLDPAPGMMHLLSGDAIRAFLASVERANNNDSANRSSMPPNPPNNDDSKMDE